MFVAPMDFHHTLHPHYYHHHVNFHLLSPFPPMASCKPLDPSAAPFLPFAAPPPPPPPPELPLWRRPHLYRSFRVGGYGKKAKAGGKKGGGATYGTGGMVRRFVPPRLMFRPQQKDPRWSDHSFDNKLVYVPKDFKLLDDGVKAEDVILDGVNDADGEDDDEADAVASGLSGRTTVMIRNIPNLLKRQDLIEILDEHCRKANARRSESRSEYDFVYLPVDYKRKANKGYAFVSFTTDEAAVRIWSAFDGFKWEGFRWNNVCYRSKKVCKVCAAATQGKASLEVTLRRRSFPREEYQPVAAAAAPRDGMNGAPMTLVGKCSKT